MVLDVWQANLMRAFAQQRLRQDEELAADAGLDPDQLGGFPGDEVGMQTHCAVVSWQLFLLVDSAGLTLSCPVL